MSTPLLDAVKQDGYRYGDCQAIPYRRSDQTVFKPGFLGDLYFKLKGDRYSRRREGNGILETLFCGMSDVSYDAIVGYLATRPIVVLGVWRSTEGAEPVFEVAGITFVVTMLGNDEEKACFAGYGFLPKFWGTDEQETLTIMGLSALFGELGVLSVHGIRYADNDLTARFMERFGFSDVGEIPQYMLRRHSLVSAVISTLPRETFEAKLQRRAIEAYRDGQGRGT